ncbi:response regulator transcription factor [Rhodococcus oxybenzonivorans]|nr:MULTISPECIES: response regulator transcription factor [Rhodococcus]MDV7246752.1 response regulator transcription factor [Rhodococcus oxybenzonivorans]MDV7337765.1 response regulator transcription factor [Rhodococcus oxybenzonivorans]MDV7347821.1 response regulator transcription factor [Rhodococcus oxybenzonivorans]MDV8031529.1 response regulator transcription factor [Rhodococcus sp. IEGM 27]
MNSFSVPASAPVCVLLIDVAVGQLLLGRARTAGVDAIDVAVLDLRSQRQAHGAVRTLRATRFGGAVVVIDQGRSSRQRIAALEAGADDVLDVQVSEEEFVARIRAILRRAKSIPHPMPPTDVPGLNLNWGCRTVERHGLRRTLTQTEFNLMVVLAMNAGRLVLRQHLLLIVWGVAGESRTKKVLNTYISSLRQKLASIGAPHTVHTTRGVGFSLQERESRLPR